MITNGGIVWVVAGIGLWVGGMLVLYLGYLLGIKLGIFEDRWWEF